jgi:hypothetical protein
VALADTSMHDWRARRQDKPVGTTLNRSRRPARPNVVQAMLCRCGVTPWAAVPTSRTPPVHHRPADIDQMAAALNHKVNQGRVYSA